MSDRDRPLYAILIDADNIPSKYAGAILKEITTFGEPALRRVYGDWSSGQLKGWADTVRAHGLVAHQETANTKGKNASDIGLVIDAMDILHTGRFDGFVLVSSDSDFTALANRIREQGMDVIGIGEGKAPESLRNVCNRFILIENIYDEPAPLILGETAIKSSKRPPAEAVPLILKAMDKIPLDDEWFTLGQLGQYIVRDSPDFDVRTYGEKKLSELIKKLPRFQTRQVANQMQVRRAD